ncbi:SHD1 domain-containing protein [Paludisphaera sp.]|uniref:SHD1 domain-containing protein n=1 Tax=Paludisphaera sp. TaxID=2017432 RepID=UPI00301C6574
MRAVLDRAAVRRGLMFVGLVLALAVSGRADEPEMRTWQDASGRFKIQAKFVALNGKNVVLQKADGTRMQVDIEKLRSADSQYVEAQRKKLAEEDPFKPVPAEEDPFKPAPAVATPSPRARPGRVGAMRSPAARPGASATPDDRQATPGVAPEIHPDWSAATMAEMAPDGPWTLDVGPAPAPSDAEARPRALPVPPKVDFFEKTKGLVVNTPATHALAGFAMDNPKPGTTRVVLGDLASGKLLGQFRSEGSMAPLALSDAGDRALMRTDEFGFGNSYRLELWDIGPDGLNKAWSLAPYGDMEGGDRDVKWARFLGPGRFATLGGKGKLVIWDLDPVQPRTILSVDENCTPGLSPDGRFLAFVDQGNVGVLDVEGGRITALQAMPTKHVPWPSLGFSPSGKRLACVSGSKLHAWSTEDGSALPEILLAPIAVGPNVPTIWTDEEHVLVAERYLVDVASEVIMWQYDGAESVVGDRAGLCWFLLGMSPNQPGAVVPARLPQPAAVNALKQALANPESFALRPGATVTIDVNGVPDASERDKIARALTDRLARNQVKVAPGSPLVLAATVTPGKEQEISYRTFGAGFRTDNFKVRPQVSGIKLTFQGQLAWEAAATTLPMMDFAHLGPNETLADHVKKFERPNYGFFEGVEIPRRVARPGPGGPVVALGSSQVSATGVR